MSIIKLSLENKTPCQNDNPLHAKIRPHRKKSPFADSTDFLYKTNFQTLSCFPDFSVSQYLLQLSSASSILTTASPSSLLVGYSHVAAAWVWSLFSASIVFSHIMLQSHTNALESRRLKCIQGNIFEKYVEWFRIYCYPQISVGEAT